MADKRDPFWNPKVRRTPSPDSDSTPARFVPVRYCPRCRTDLMYSEKAVSKRQCPVCKYEPLPPDSDSTEEGEWIGPLGSWREVAEAEREGRRAAESDRDRYRDALERIEGCSPSLVAQRIARAALHPTEDAERDA